MELISPADQLLFTTMRIVVKKDDVVCLGTGFIFNYDNNFFIVTCKHVVSEAKEGVIYALRGADGKPMLGNILPIKFEGSDIWYLNPITM